MKRHRYYIEPLEYSVNGYTHRLRRTTSTDNGKSFHDSGVVRHFRSEVEAMKYKHNLENGPDAWRVFYDVHTGRELKAYTMSGTFPGEYDDTLGLLCWEYDITVEDITSYLEVWER